MKLPRCWTRVLIVGGAVISIFFTIWQFGAEADHAPHEDRLIRIMPPLASAPLRVAVLGTSLTAQYDWPDLVAVRLADCLGRNVEMSVAARVGASSDWGVAQLPRILAQSPDLVLIEFAANDADIRDGLSITKSESNLRTIVTRLEKSIGSGIALMTMSPAQGVRGWLRPAQGKHAALYRHLASEFELGLIDLRPRWMALPRLARGLGRDGLHPEPEVANSIIVPVVSQWIARSVGRECPISGTQH